MILTGAVRGYRLSGVEPDGDPLYQVVLQTKLAASGGNPAVNLIVSSYLENFQPDTTPVLPDILPPGAPAQNLGGFLEGKVLLTDDGGNVLSIGSFVAEAFLDNANHVGMTLFGSGRSGSRGSLRGTFALNHGGALTGRLGGTLHLSAEARKQIARNQGATMKPLKDIISVVTVVPHYYGRNGKGQTGPPLHTGFGSVAAVPDRQGVDGGPSGTPGAQSATTRQISPWTIVAGTGAVFSLALAGILFWMERRKARQVKPAA